MKRIDDSYALRTGSIQGTFEKHEGRILCLLSQADSLVCRCDAVTVTLTVTATVAHQNKKLTLGLVVNGEKTPRRAAGGIDPPSPLDTDCS
jgi:hypothetical protein